MSEAPMTTADSPVIQVACPTCGAQPRQRCKTKSQMEARYFHASRYEVDPAEDAETGEKLIFNSLTEEYERISKEVTTGARHGMMPPEIDPEVEELEGVIYNRALQANIDRGLQAALLRTMDTGKVQPRFGKANKNKTAKRRAKNRVARKSRKANRK